MEYNEAKQNERSEIAAACILVAEDDPDMREEVTNTLRKQAYFVIEFDTGDRLFEYVRGSVVSDGHVGEMTFCCWHISWWKRLIVTRSLWLASQPRQQNGF